MKLRCIFSILIVSSWLQRYVHYHDDCRGSYRDNYRDGFHDDCHDDYHDDCHDDGSNDHHGDYHNVGSDDYHNDYHDDYRSFKLTIRIVLEFRVIPWDISCIQLIAVTYGTFCMIHLDALVAVVSEK